MRDHFLSLLPSFNKNDLVVIFHNAYFDESYSGDGSIFVLSGYIFEKGQAEIFSAEWKQYIGTLGLSYAHMADCVHRTGEYKYLTLKQCDESARALIGQILKRTLFSVSVSINPNEYNDIMRSGVSDQRLMSEYTLLMMGCVTKNRQMLRGYNSKILYIFESGHKSAMEASQYMEFINKPPMKDFYSLSGYAFMNKSSAAPLQAADMMAWQYRKYRSDIGTGRRKEDDPREDFRAMTRVTDLMTHVDSNDILKIKATLLRLYAYRDRNDRKGYLDYLNQLFNLGGFDSAFF